MGGGYSEPIVAGVPAVHVSKLNMSGKPVKGGFSSGPKTMEKIRTRSDFCLLKIVEQDIVRKAFSQWAKAEAATYLDFVLEVNEMKNSSAGLQQRVKIIEIFGKFIPEKAKKKLTGLDSATRRTIMLAFETKTYDPNVFDLAYEKAYQTLKFDYMPQFLISDDFMKLEDNTSVRRGSAGTLIEIKVILSDAKALKAFTLYLQAQVSKPEQLQYMRLWEDISDFKKDYEKMNGADANKRAKKLWETVKAGLQLPSHLRVTTNDNVNGNKNAEKGPGMDCFDDVQNFLCDMLQAENQRAFLVSKEYQDFLANAPDDYKLDSVVLTLKDFKEDRQLEKTKDDFVTDLNMLLRLENVLEDPLLTAYFRRFLRISFQEENYLFFQDVQDMKVQHYIKAASTEISPDMSLGEILEVTAVKIFDKFIKAGAMFQVNISADVREEVVRMVENNEITANMYVRGAVRCGASEASCE
ncbi:hypothetical protein TeGR_g4448 [Tetraparma gracilis]|uniref:RGS domain-containing protein n=1 Tax=Tetraparma gracilis TaxID=2962635 RepID=A0ABQ6M8N5_9STRA|nr:hypothetical protein TeGR_g4448 [Tetraparma gracilis]